MTALSTREHGPMIIIKCKTCGKEFEARSYYYKVRKYHNRECYYEAMRAKNEKSKQEKAGEV